MSDMLQTIIPKSDQLNSDSLLGRSITIKVTKVSILAGEQPVAIHYENDDGKPFKPCKGMRRVIVNCWGSDANLYVGRSMTLYRDDNVTWGGQAVGGIRISHLSHIISPVTMALTASKSVRKAYTVQPLITTEIPAMKLDDALHDIKTAADIPDLMQKYRASYKAFTNVDDRNKLEAAKNTRKAKLEPQIANQPQGE